MKSKLKLIVIFALVITILSATVSAGAACQNTTTAVKGQSVSDLAAALNKAKSSSALKEFLKTWCASSGQTGQNQETPAVTTPSVPEVPTGQDTPVQPEVPVQTPETPSASETPSTSSSYVTEVIRLVNVERAKQGLSALTENTELSKVAQLKSQDMHDNKYFSHTSPTYGSPFDMMKKFGITYSSAGENIAMGYKTPAAVVEGWMNSSGHRANILSSSFTQIGIGYVSSGNYWTQMFIG